MIYKIMGNFTNKTFNEKLNNVKKYFKFIYKNGNLFLSIFSYKKTGLNTDYEKIIKENFDIKEGFVFFEINENNLMREDKDIIEWSRDNFVRLEKERYEIEQQDKLKKTMKALDNLEDILIKEKIRRNQEGREG